MNSRDLEEGLKRRLCESSRLATRRLDPRLRGDDFARVSSLQRSHSREGGNPRSFTQPLREGRGGKTNWECHTDALGRSYGETP